ncbi:MAG: hypothetical protein EAZ08_01385 [Cytophagales bacterium]|nr:MAG: hypothetical protein EAZ08_01385 [Cytophagales bacterium]
MAYNKFKKLEDLRKRLGIKDVMEVWLPESLSEIKATSRLLEDLEEARYEALTTEKAKSEYIVVPIIKELHRHNVDKFSSFSGFEFNVDKSKGLTGFCDFILSAQAKQLEITAPIFCLVEAKNAEIEKGLAQCGAEMHAAQIYNERENNPQKIIYGCVTNAFSWCFLKLEEKKLYIDPNYVPLTFAKPHNVLSALQWILDKALAEK